jgi:hypothetical protein
LPIEAGTAETGPLVDAGACTYTGDRATLRVERPGATPLDCTTTLPGWVDGGIQAPVDGVVTSVSPTSFSVNTCPSPADCVAPSITTFQVSATRLDGTSLTEAISEGSFVHVEYYVGRFFSCQMSLEVTSLPTFQGMPNPKGAARTILLALVDGGGPLANSTYTAARVKLPCTFDTGPSCIDTNVGAYAFSFAPKDVSAARPPVELRMGETKEIDLQPPGALGTVIAHNLRSYQGCGSDAFWDYAYYLVGRPPTR